MSISITKYVDITSGIGAGAAVKRRELIGRLFTTNPFLPVKSFSEFDNANDVATYFGAASEEYKRAAFYFGWISKQITRAQKISFGRFVDVDSPPLIYGASAKRSLDDFKAITAGKISVSIRGETKIISGINLSAITSFSDVAQEIQDAITMQFTSAPDTVVTFDAVRQSFNLVAGGSPIDGTIGIKQANSDPLAGLLGWLQTGAIISDGCSAQSITDTLIESADASSNFGSFAFIPNLLPEEIEEAAKWCAAQNVLYQHHVSALKDDAEALQDQLKGYSGTSLTIINDENDYSAMLPMIILAATDYSRPDASQNYMYQRANLKPSVLSTQESNKWDSLRINYYGRTQTAGQTIDFYQRGVLMGSGTDPLDMNIYANEQWLKSTASTTFIEFLLAVSRVPANNSGCGQILTILQSVIDQALINGVISVGKTLTQIQKIEITNMSLNPDAWHQVQSQGYWRDCFVENYVAPDGRIEYKAKYILIYSKDDVIRKIEGTHSLI